jgi:hypothetical protein
MVSLELYSETMRDESLYHKKKGRKKRREKEKNSTGIF